jgi:NTP pyrophosphatase (non-canonical NTP hydrolase)
MNAPQIPPPFERLTDVRDELRRFAAERDWNQFHTPKNLAMALIVEAAEVVEHFQWRTADESDAFSAEERTAVGAELADVLFYLVRLADRLDIDLAAAARAKIAVNEAKYPAARVRGSARKYSDYDNG